MNTRRHPSLAALLLTLGLASSAPAAAYFRVTSTAQDRWTLLDPAGKPFFSTGVCVLQPFDSSIPPGGQGYDPVKHDSEGIAAWAGRTAGRLKAWKVNTVGAWSHETMWEQGLAYTVSLALLGYDNPENRLVDLWDPKVEAAMRAEARRGTEGRQDDPLLLGYFLDNELPWYGNTGWPGPQNTPLLDKYLALEAQAPGKGQAVAAVMAWYKDKLAALPRLDGQAWKSWDAFLEARPERDSLAWPADLRDRFAGLVAQRYFKLAVKAVKAADPNHMVLGCRFAGPTPDAVLAAAQACDIVSVNSYQKTGRFDQELFDRVYLLTRRPLMLTEFG